MKEYDFYVIPTPIGNLGDITLRAIETLKNVDIIACEDTRNSLKLLNHYQISKKLIAYHKFNEKSSADGIIALAKQNKNIAVISDAGMPVISDPGQILIDKLIDLAIKKHKQNNLCKFDYSSNVLKSNSNNAVKISK